MAGIYYETVGQGEPLVLLHGNGEDHSLFNNLAESFKAEFRLIMIDSRGHGKSEWVTPMTIEAMAEDVRSVLDELGIQSAHVLGFSDGANVAITLALRHPGRVLSLAATGGNLFPGGVRLRVQAPIVLWYWALCAQALIDKKIERKKQVIGLMVKYPHIDSAELAAIAVPALVVAGERDMIKTSHTRLIAASIPAARLAILPGADHFAIIKQPEAFNKTVMEFLKSLPKAARSGC